MKIKEYILCFFTWPSVIYETRRCLVKANADLAKAKSSLAVSQDITMFCNQREARCMDKIASLERDLEKKQQEHDLTFHQLHMLKASVEAHINRAKVQEEIINHQQAYINFIRSCPPTNYFTE